MHDRSGGSADDISAFYDDDGGDTPDGPGALEDFVGEIVTGTCDACKLHTLLVGIDGTFFRCISCGEDLEQKVNGVIKYVVANDLESKVPHGKD